MPTSFKTADAQATDNRDGTTDDKERLGGSGQGLPEEDNDDCTRHYHGKRHNFNERTTVDRVPSAGWRAVYAAMGVRQQ